MVGRTGREFTRKKTENITRPSEEGHVGEQPEKSLYSGVTAQEPARGRKENG